MKRSEKDQIIAEVSKKVARAKGMFFADFTGITVEEINGLRREFRKSNIDYQVVKNTLVRKALETVGGYEAVLSRLEKPTAIAFSYDDPVSPAKIMKKFREKNEKLVVKVCVVEKQVFEGKQLNDIAKLPTRKEIIAGVLGSIQAPIAGVVGAISAVMRDIVSIVDQIEKKKAA
ncbi:MAG: 50S ribosomal protein L10 [Ignavibacteriae bacterium]|nr:50S ribosomal protein L10 [Ignavibacteria bacterium]MBI3365574.1 50S ribosomal protein L10 [Ignavibacteriota bacterium]